MTTPTLIIVALALLAFASAVVGTAALRRYAIRRSLMDIPNARSSHTVAVPRGGGVAIVGSFLGCLLALHFLGLLPGTLIWAVLGAGGVAALVGFLDDHGHVPARWRLLTHFSCAAWALAWTGLPAVVGIGTFQLEIGWLAYVVAAAFLVWMLNLYNFMDGIDGIASIQIICVAAGGALMYWGAGHAGHAAANILLAAATAGFLVWNFPPARIFMGDAGSGFLGLVVGIFAIDAAMLHGNYFWAYLILSALFIVDASYTLARRLCRAKRVYEAHRSHAYQHAARRYRSEERRV